MAIYLESTVCNIFKSYPVKKAAFVTFIAILSIFAALFSTGALGAVAFSTGSATAPSWISEGEYFTVPESAIYETENWNKILGLRAMAEAGEKGSSDEYMSLWRELIEKTGQHPYDNGLLFEYALVNYKTYLNGQVDTGTIPVTMAPYDAFKKVADAFPIGSTERKTALIWCYRAYAWKNNPNFDFDNHHTFKPGVRDDMIHELMQYSDFSRNKLLAHPDFEKVKDTRWYSQASAIIVTLDGRKLSFDALPEIKDGSTMVPIAPIASAIGADVGWDGDIRSVTIKRAAIEIVLRIDEKDAVVNGKILTMNTAPYIKDSRTMLPMRFISEHLSQSVDWDGTNRLVTIVENMAFADSGNLNDWFLGCGAILAKRNNDDPYKIGMSSRTETSVNSKRRLLQRDWGIESRDDLIETINAMSYNGHNVSFMTEAEFVNSLSASKYQQLLSQSMGMDAYMWPLVKELGNKWGSRGIAAWDWFRMTHLAGWGYIVGYLELEEAYALAVPSIMGLRANFSSWDEATENYMDGYAYWSRTDVSQEETQYKIRLQIYENLKAAEVVDGVLFNPTVWTQKIPEFTMPIV